MMPNLKLTEREYRNIVNYQRVNFGGEAIICESDNPYTVYKIFNHYGEPKKMSKNKMKKLEILHELKPEYSIQPIRTISLNDMIIGYEMTTDFGLETYKLYELSPEEIKYYLTKTKEILEYYSSLGIIYGDIDPRNILFDRDTGEIKFCDMDNIAYKDLPMDTTPFHLQFYETERKIDDSVHPYMHNLMTMRAIDLNVYGTTRFALRKSLKRPGVKTVISMAKPKDFNGEYILPYVKKFSKNFIF